MLSFVKTYSIPLWTLKNSIKVPLNYLSLWASVNSRSKSQWLYRILVTWLAFELLNCAVYDIKFLSVRYVNTSITPVALKEQPLYVQHFLWKILKNSILFYIYINKPERLYQNQFILKHLEILNVKRRPYKSKKGTEVIKYNEIKRFKKYFVHNAKKQ